MIFRRRFADLVARQLDVFAADEAALLAECADRERAYVRAGREEAEEAYGDYMDAVDAATEALADMRDRYARTLEPPAAGEYTAVFDRAVRKRWPAFGLEIGDR